MSVRDLMSRHRWVSWAAPAAVAIVAVGGLGVAQAATHGAVAAGSSTMTMTMPGMGQNQFGKTEGDIDHANLLFTYSKGFFCDTTVPATSTTGCEVGQGFNHPPAASYDPLYITVPLGFTVPAMAMQCPNKLVCVDHPATLDLTRLAAALAPIYHTTAAKLAPELRNIATPGHDHFVTTLNNGQPEWWDVVVIGVTSPSVYKAIAAHGSFAYIRWLQDHHNPAVTGDIPTNLFLYFSVR
jgi:hypothetical protein